MIPGLLVVRVGAPLYFANVQWVEDKLNAFAKRAAKYSREAGTELRYIIFDLSPVNHVDTQGVTLLEELAEQFGARGIQLVLTNPAPRVVRTWEDAGLFNKLSRRWVFARVHDAVTTCRGLLGSEPPPAARTWISCTPALRCRAESSSAISSGLSWWM